MSDKYVLVRVQKYDDSDGYFVENYGTAFDDLSKAIDIGAEFRYDVICIDKNGWVGMLGMPDKKK